VVVRADMRTWECGFRTIFLCEYHLLTGDREVLPAIEALTLALARGQGMYGTFGQGVFRAGGRRGVFKEASWHLDLVRRCDGPFTYDGGEQYGPGSTDDDTYFGKSGYYGLSPTASYVLTYALPLRAICLTGRQAVESQWLDDGEVAEAVMSGRFDTDRATMATEGVVAALGD
jgi:hypothetical protein